MDEPNQAMNQSDRLRATLTELLAAQNLAVLSTHQDGQPYASLVAFVAVDELKQIVFATARTTRKFSNLQADPRVAVLIDSRTNQPCDFHQAIAVTATGEAEELSGTEKERYAALYLAKHPHLEDFLRAPTCALIKIRVQCYYLVSRFQNVMELHISP